VIYFCGDTHGCFDHIIDVVGQDRPAAVVFLGDLQAQRPWRSSWPRSSA
jgi:hypothetical protein